MALVSKILEATLTAGSTSVTFTDADIPNSLIRVFSSDSTIIPESRILSGTTLTVTYAAQESNMDVALEIVKQGLDIVDNVLSEDTDKALSAKQGYLLDAAIGDVNDRIDGLVIPDNITDLDDVNVTSIEDGQVLAWDENTSTFVNVDQAASTSYPVIKKNWIASSSSVTGTALTDTETLPAGKYIINVHLPYSVLTTTAVFALSINNAIDNSQICVTLISYGNCSFIVEKNESFTIKFVSGSSNSLTWDSSYLDRGAMYILRIP